MYADVQELKKSILSCSDIRLELQKRHGVTLGVETVRSWATGSRTPASSGHVFVPKPNPDLAYIIGVEMGDGSLNARPDNYQYKIRLKAVDVEFVEAFNRAVANVLNCPPNRPWKGKTERETYVDYGSYLLHKFLLQPLDAFKPFIEHDKLCVAAFLRGFFDSEGCIDTLSIISASNSNLELLEYVQELLSKWFGIKTSGPRLTTRKGSLITSRGKTYIRRADCFSIYLSTRFNARFDKDIGFTIRRKQLRLDNYLSLTHSRAMRLQP